MVVSMKQQASYNIQYRWWSGLVLCLGLGLWGVHLSQASSSDTSPVVVISGVYFDGFLRGSPEPEEAIQLTNTHPSKTADVGGWKISDRFLLLGRTRRRSRRRRSRRRRSRRRRSRRRRSRRRRSRRRRSRRRRSRSWRSRGSSWRSRRRSRRSRYGRTSRRRLGSDRDSGFSPKVGRRSVSQNAHNIVLPVGTKIPPGGSIWIAHRAQSFFRVFGKKPAVEGVDTDENVPNASLSRGWPQFFATRGIVSLHNSLDATVDVVCYVRDSYTDNLNRARVPSGQWYGASVLLKGANPYSWTGQVLARDRLANAQVSRDTNTARDWNSSFASTKLGEDETHRVERPGQSHFHFPKLLNTSVEMLVTSAPENNYRSLLRAFRRARHEIRINIYKFTNYRIAIPLVKAARRGVKITVLMEGAPVGGVEERSRYIARMLHRAGVKVLWMRGVRKRKIFRRYRFNHAKYVIIDRKWSIIGSENYGTTGHPVDPSQGNRGWEIHIRSRKLASQLLQVFRDDTDVSRFRDLVRYREKRLFRKFKWGPPKPGFRVSRKIRRGTYSYRRPALRIRGKVDLELVLSPDNSLHEKGSLIGSILSCKREVLVIQNSIPLYWGKKHRRSFKSTPDLPLAAVLQAARKGCKVRVIVDSVWYHISPRDKRDNDDAVQKINEIAHREQLDLQAKLVNLESAGISKIHAKGVIVDRQTTFIGSINWSENSFKGNREVGILIKNRKVAQYYTDLFMYDWIHSRLFRVSIKGFRAPVYKSPNALSRVLRYYEEGDPVDVLSEEGEFYQIRLPHLRVGYIRKAQHVKLFNPFEARFQVGQYGVLIGRVRRSYTRRKMFQFFFDRLDRSGMHLVVWRSQAGKFKHQHGDLRRALVGKWVQVRGRVTSFRGRPQIVLRNPKDLTILQ